MGLCWFSNGSHCCKYSDLSLDFVPLLQRRISCINHWRIDRQLDGQVFYAILEIGKWQLYHLSALPYRSARYQAAKVHFSEEGPKIIQILPSYTLGYWPTSILGHRIVEYFGFFGFSCEKCTLNLTDYNTSQKRSEFLSRLRE